MAVSNSITVAGKTQWDVAITYASPEALEASRDMDRADGAIGTLQGKIDKWSARITKPSYVEYAEEIQADIAQWRSDLEEQVAKRDEARRIFIEAGGCSSILD